MGSSIFKNIKGKHNMTPSVIEDSPSFKNPKTSKFGLCSKAPKQSRSIIKTFFYILRKQASLGLALQVLEH
jgi:hypothetical protein